PRGHSIVDTSGHSRLTFRFHNDVQCPEKLLPEDHGCYIDHGSAKCPLHISVLLYR
ncbi:hypothetical protein RRG08_066194, partial [Elysia crispata]